MSYFTSFMACLMMITPYVLYGNIWGSVRAGFPTQLPLVIFSFMIMWMVLSLVPTAINMWWGHKTIEWLKIEQFATAICSLLFLIVITSCSIVYLENYTYASQACGLNGMNIAAGNNF